MAGKEKINPNQLRKIWATAREMGMDEDVLRARVAALTGSESISSMTKQQAGILIDTLTNPAAKRTDRATQEQVWKMNQLAGQLGWDNPKRLLGFIRKYAKVDSPAWLTSRQAWRVIEGLKKMLEKVG